MTFLRYDQLPDVSKEWEAYGLRCKENLEQFKRELPLPIDPDAFRKAREAKARWEQRHALNWAAYQAEWHAALLRHHGGVNPLDNGK